MNKHCVVIGGGVAGLVAARQMSHHGMQVDVFEATGSFGGAVASLDIAGITADAGAEAISVLRPAGLDLIADLGLRDSLVRPRRTDSRIATREGLLELPPGVLGIPTDLSDPRVSALMRTDEIASVGKQQSFTVSPDASLGSVVRTHLGDAVADRIVDPVVSGVHAAGIDDVDFAALLPGMAELALKHGGLLNAAQEMRAGLGPSGSAVASLNGGMHNLAIALQEACLRSGVRLFTRREVTAAHRTSAGWEIIDQQGLVTTTDALILAVPPSVAASLLMHTPAMQEIAQSLSLLRVTPVRVVTLMLESADLDSFPFGPGVLVSAERNDLAAKALTHSNAKWEWWDSVLPAHRHVVRLSYGRAGHPAPDADALSAQAVKDIQALLPAKSNMRVIDTAVTTWADSLAFPTPGHASRISLVKDKLKCEDRLSVISSALAGNGLAGVIDYAQHEGQRIANASTIASAEHHTYLETK